MTLRLKIGAAQFLLCRSLKDDESEGRVTAIRRLWQELGDEQVFALAQANGVTSMLAHALMDALGPEHIPAHWQQIHEQTCTRISAYMAELDRIAVRLSVEGILVVALKNGGIARGVYPCRGCCPMGDLDVLVERRYFRKAHQILLSEGYRFEFRSPLEETDLKVAERSGGAEYWKLLPGGEKLWLELQWRPVAGRWIRPDQEPSAEELMARSVPIPGTAVRLLAPEDNLLQVALHTAKHSYVRAPGFRLHLDVDRIVRRQLVDWDLFLSRVLVFQVKTAVYFSLAIPKALFGTPIPDEVLDRLRPPAWKERWISRWVQRARLFDPDERKFSKPGFVLFTALLYEDLGGLWRGVLPDHAWMRIQYGSRRDTSLPICYLRRIYDLVMNRQTT